MAVTTKRIQDLPSAGTPAVGDFIPTAQLLDGITRHMTVSQILALATAANINTINPRAFDAKIKYGVKADGVQFTDGSITSGQATFTSTTINFVAGDVGKLILMNGAGASGAPLSTTISAVNGHTCTLAANAGTTVSSAGIGYYGTDDTAAWNTAIADMVTRGGGGLFCYGITMNGGALTQFTNANAQHINSQIVIPYTIPFASDKVVIEIFGPYSDGFFPTIGQTAPQSGGLVFLSTLVGQSHSNTYGNPSMIGGPTLTASTQPTYTYYSNVFLRLQNVRFRCPSNPTLAAVNLNGVQQVALRGVMADTTDAYANIATVPTNPTGLGIMMPYVNNNDRCYIDECSAYGYYGGIGIGEHTSGTNLTAAKCNAGLFMLNKTMGHGALLGYVSVESNPYCLAGIDVVSGVESLPAQIAPLVIQMLDIENATGAFGPVDHVLDANNAFYGFITYLLSKSSLGPSVGPLSNSGCGNLRFLDAMRAGSGFVTG